MILRIMKNMESAQHYGSIFGQDVEPSGTYVIEKDADRTVKEPWVSGLAVIKNPLIIEVDDDTQISYKYELAKEYKAKGKQLTKKLMGLGYDAIITMRNGDSGEIILFPNCEFMLNSLNENKFLIKTLLRENLLPEAAESTVEMYHGSPTQISKFMDDFVGGKDANDQEGPGIYFTSSWQNARSYGGYIYTVKLSPIKVVSTQEGKNASPKELEWLMKQAPDWEGTAQNWDENPMRGLKIAVNDFIKYNENPHNQFLQVWIDFYRDNPVEYVRNMTKLGYDAVIVDNLNSLHALGENVKHIIVLNPSIIEFIKVEDDN